MFKPLRINGIDVYWFEMVDALASRRKRRRNISTANLHILAKTSEQMREKLLQCC
jgi:hypothetical protein